MELRHLRYFLAVAEEGNFTRAARGLGIGQPPLSQQIRDLEDEIGTRLFRRVPHGAELTDAGKAFLQATAELPGKVRSAIEAAQRAARGETGAIRVGFTGSAAFNPIVPNAIRAYRRRFPAVDLTLREGNSVDLIDALREGNLDAAFLRPDSVDLVEFESHMLDAEPLIAAIPSSSAPAANRIVLCDLANQPFVLTPRPLGPTLFDAAISACRMAGFDPILGQSAPQIASVLPFVAAELGVSLVPASMRRAMVQGVAYRDLDDARLTVSLAITCRRGETSPAVRQFTAKARSEAAGSSDG